MEHRLYLLVLYVTLVTANPCSNRMLGSQPYPHDCGSYIVCWLSIPYLNSCPQDQLYDTQTNSCQPSHLSICCNITFPTTTQRTLLPHSPDTTKTPNISTSIPIITTKPDLPPITTTSFTTKSSKLPNTVTPTTELVTTSIPITVTSVKSSTEAETLVTDKPTTISSNRTSKALPTTTVKETETANLPTTVTSVPSHVTEEPSATVQTTVSSSPQPSTASNESSIAEQTIISEETSKPPTSTKLISTNNPLTSTVQAKTTLLPLTSTYSPITTDQSTVSVQSTKDSALTSTTILPTEIINASRPPISTTIAESTSTLEPSIEIDNSTTNRNDTSIVTSWPLTSTISPTSPKITKPSILSTVTESTSSLVSTYNPNSTIARPTTTLEPLSSESVSTYENMPITAEISTVTKPDKEITESATEREQVITTYIPSLPSINSSVSVTTPTSAPKSTIFTMETTKATFEPSSTMITQPISTIFETEATKETATPSYISTTETVTAENPASKRIDMTTLESSTTYEPFTTTKTSQQSTIYISSESLPQFVNVTTPNPISTITEVQTTQSTMAGHTTTSQVTIPPTHPPSVPPITMTTTENILTTHNPMSTIENVEHKLTTTQPLSPITVTTPMPFSTISEVTRTSSELTPTVFTITSTTVEPVTQTSFKPVTFTERESVEPISTTKSSETSSSSSSFFTTYLPTGTSPSESMAKSSTPTTEVNTAKTEKTSNTIANDNFSSTAQITTTLKTLPPTVTTYEPPIPTSSRSTEIDTSTSKSLDFSTVTDSITERLTTRYSEKTILPSITPTLESTIMSSTFETDITSTVSNKVNDATTQRPVEISTSSIVNNEVTTTPMYSVTLETSTVSNSAIPDTTLRHTTTAMPITFTVPPYETTLITDLPKTSRQTEPVAQSSVMDHSTFVTTPSDSMTRSTILVTTPVIISHSSTELTSTQTPPDVTSITSNESSTQTPVIISTTPEINSSHSLPDISIGSTSSTTKFPIRPTTFSPPSTDSTTITVDPVTQQGTEPTLISTVMDESTKLTTEQDGTEPSTYRPTTTLTTLESNTSTKTTKSISTSPTISAETTFKLTTTSPTPTTNTGPLISTLSESTPVPTISPPSIYTTQTTNHSDHKPLTTQKPSTTLPSDKPTSSTQPPHPTYPASPSSSTIPPAPTTKYIPPCFTSPKPTSSTLKYPIPMPACRPGDHFFYPDVTNCSFYHQCVYGNMMKKKCKYGYHFNPRALKCMPRIEANCRILPLPLGQNDYLTEFLQLYHLQANQ